MARLESASRLRWPRRIMVSMTSLRNRLAEAPSPSSPLRSRYSQAIWNESSRSWESETVMSKKPTRTVPVPCHLRFGPATSAKMNSLGLHTGLDMRNQTLEFMQANFGKAGAYYYWISRGVDNREVRANRIRKSVGAENTFASDLTQFEPMMSELQPLIDKVWRHCEENGTRGRTVTLKVKFAVFELLTRSRTLPASVDSCPNLESVTLDLLRLVFPLKKAVRLLGVSVSGFIGDDASNHSKQIALEL